MAFIRRYGALAVPSSKQRVVGKASSLCPSSEKSWTQDGCSEDAAPTTLPMLPS